MKRIFEKVLATVLLLSIPVVAFASFSVPWAATSSSQQWTFPSAVNGVFYTAYVPNLIASSTNATSTFAGGVGIGTTTALTALSVAGQTTLTPFSEITNTLTVTNAIGKKAVQLGTYPTSNQYGGIWTGNITPDINNYTLITNGDTESVLNVPNTTGNIVFRSHNNNMGAYNSNGLAIGATSAGPTSGIGLTVASGKVGFGTTTPGWALSVNGTTTAAVFIATTTATSTSGGGWNITSGCFAVSNVCVTGGGATLSGGSVNTLTYWTSGTTVGATSSPTVGYIIATSSSNSTFAGSVGIGNTSPNSKLEVTGGISMSATAATRIFKVENSAADTAAGTLAIKGANGVSSANDVNGGNVTITAGDGSASGATATGGTVTITGGASAINGLNTVNGGGVSIQTGMGAGIASRYGNVTIEAGVPAALTGFILLGNTSLAKVGLGATSTPSRQLSVAGTSDLGTNALAGTFTATTTTGTSTFAGAVGIGTTTPIGKVDLNGSFYVETASTTVWSYDFCTMNNSQVWNATSTNSTINFINASNCVGKSVVFFVVTPNSGTIGSTTFSGSTGSGPVTWDGGVNPGSSIVWGTTDRFLFTSISSSTPYISADLTGTF